MRERSKTFCRQFLTSGDYSLSDIYKTLSAVESIDEELRKAMVACAADSYGTVPENSLSKAARTITRVLENLLMNAMEGANVTSEQEHRGLLLYQVVSDVVLH